MNIISLTFILISISLSVIAQILLKHGMSTVQVVNEGIVRMAFDVVTNLYVFLGLLAYVTSAGFWLVVLSKMEVSKAYPFVGLGFIGTMFFAYWFLNEPLTTTKILGTLLVTAGVVLISQ